MTCRSHRYPLLLCLAILTAGCQPASFARLPTLAAPTLLPVPTLPAGPLSTPILGPLVNPLLEQLYTATATATPTITPTPTETPTRTPLPTFTSTPTDTSTPTQTPLPSLTPTPSETPIPPRPAALFPKEDLDGTRITWGYERITSLFWDRQQRPLTLTAFLSFQLLDRGIHRETIPVLERSLTVYYLNAQHEFDGRMRPVHLIIDGEWGRDVPLAALQSSSSFFVPAQALAPGAVFDPVNIHQQAAKNYADQPGSYQAGMPVGDFERQLAQSPDPLIVLADGPVRVPPSSYTDIDYYFRQTPFMAARTWNLVSLNPLKQVSGPSPYAWALVDHLFKGLPLPDEGLPDPLTYAASTLVLIPGSAQ